MIRLAANVVDGLKAAPALLALLLTNVLTIVALLYFAHAVNESRTATIERLFELCGHQGTKP